MLPVPIALLLLKIKVDSVEYKKIVDQLWGKEDVVSGKRSVGKERCIGGCHWRRLCVKQVFVRIWVL